MLLEAVWDNSVFQDTARIAVIVTVAYLLVMWIAALVWVYRDIQARTRDQVTHAFCIGMVAVFNLPGLFLYLILRPKDTLADLYDRQLEAEALLRELNEQPGCPSCRRKVSEDFVACPYCRAALRVPCASCSKPLVPAWVLCPYCAAPRPGSPARPAVVTTASVPAVSGAAQPVASASVASAPASAAPRMPTRRRPSTATYTPPARPTTPPSDAAPDTSPTSG